MAKGPRKSTVQKSAEAKERGLNPFEWLLDEFEAAANKADKRSLALDLLPYVMPRLKASEVTVNTTINAIVEIGGMDD